MDIVFGKVFEKKNITIVDDNYYKDLKNDKSTDLQTEELSINVVQQTNEDKPKIMVLPNPIIEEYRKKYKPEELTDDGIPTTETQLREIEEADKRLKEANYAKQMISRVKCLALYKMSKSIFTNTLHMNSRDRDILQKIMHSYNDVSHDEIIKEFNDIVNSEVFEDNKLDYSKLPVYDA